MRPDKLAEMPHSSRFRATAHGSDGLLIHFPIPVRGLIVILGLAFSLYIVPKILAQMAVARWRNGAQPGDAAVWIIGALIVIGAAVAVLVANWIWPHLKYAWFCRTNILVKPGNIVVGRIGILGKVDMAFDESENPAARHVAPQTWGVVGAVEIYGAGRATRIAELCSVDEQNWLVETINSIVARRPSPVARGGGPASARHPQPFDPYEIAGDSPIVIDENSSDAIRCHFAPHRGPLTWIPAFVFVGATLGVILLFFLGGELDRWKDPAGQLPTEAAVILGVLLMIASLPAAVGLWLVCARISVTLTPGQLIFRRSLGPIGRSRVVPVEKIDAITCLAYADRAVARQVHAGTQAPDAAQMDGCVVRQGDTYLLLTNDKQVDAVLGSLLRRKLAEWGRPTSAD